MVQIYKRNRNGDNLMAHYAFLDENNIVTEVIPGKDEWELLDGLTPEEWYGNFRGQRCVRTSYNNKYRVNYAGIGYQFCEDLNAPDGAFIAPQPFASWILNETTCLWKAPAPMPEDGKRYLWVEDDLNWQVIE